MTAISELSIPIHFLPKLLAASKVVPDPQKKSSTMLFAFDDAATIVSSICKFFSVGYSVCCGSLNSHTSCILTPLDIASSA